MTGNEFHKTLDMLGLPHRSFARIFGVNPKTVERWLAGQQDIPPWVRIALRLLSLRGALVEARQEAGEHIIRDGDHPERGDYPYKNGNHADD